MHVEKLFLLTKKTLTQGHVTDIQTRARRILSLYYDVGR
jgi:hypothetical protein